MKWCRNTLIILLFLVAGFSGIQTHAQSSLFENVDPTNAESLYPDSIVPAGIADYRPEGYGSCELVQLVNNVMRFLIAVSILIAVIVFMYAGYLMVIARGNAGQIQQAKEMFTNIVIGVVFLLSAYLIINTILSILLGSTSSILNWQTIECSYANSVGVPKEYGITLKEQYVDVFTPVVIGGMPTAGGGVGASCDSTSLQTGDKCYAPNRCLVDVSSGACTAISTYDSYISNAASKYGVSANVVRGIMITESGGNPNAVSPVGAIGLMQLMPGTAASACRLSASELRDPVKNIDCGVKYFASMIRKFGDQNLAIAAYNAGPGGNDASNSCPGLRKWQCPYDSGGCCSSGTVTASTCTVNTGYRETRAYVDKVNAAAPRCRK